MKNDEKWFETILSSIADGVFTVDQRWRITSFNRAAERITGVSAEDAIGKPCWEVFHANICENRCALKHSMNTGEELVDVAARIQNSSGEPVPISISTAVLRDTKGEVLGGVETFRDLSTLERLRREIDGSYTFADMVGKSEGLQKIFDMLPDVAESEATVLIEGPSGSGKELLARAVHRLSKRQEGPLVVVNCGALPETLFESELFGYVKGAFTDAATDKPGRLARAEGGTIFFDEVAELPPTTQVKLLRVLQQREYEPLGGVESVPANVRVVAATNQKLAELVSQGKFRDDLYFRLAVVRMNIPPLRERREDIPLLVAHFVERFKIRRDKAIQGVSDRVMALLMRYDLPGNVRELENIIEHGFVLCHGNTIELEHLPEELQTLAVTPVRRPQTQGAPNNLKHAEASLIEQTLERCGGHLGRTAAELGISRTTLWRKMRQYDLAARKLGR